MDLADFRKLTRIEQTFFGLPFILSAVFLVYITQDFSLNFSFFWILAAFISARISGMAFNQVIDHKIDARNPRTKHRVVAIGKVSPKQGLSIAFSALFLFLFSCKMLSTKLFLFALPVACLIMIYSYCKRFTFLAHFVLGAIHFSGPFFTALALYPHLSLPLFFLALSAFFLFTGSDIAYALLDVTFDRKEDLYSAPAILGVPFALRISQALHIFALLSLFGVGFFSPVNPLFYLSPFVATIAFFCCHHQIKKLVFHKKTSKIEPLFFSTNVIVSTSILLFLLLGNL